VCGRLHAAGTSPLPQFPAITRLGARIDDLEKEGYVFQAKSQRGDYVYRLISRPHVATPKELCEFFDRYPVKSNT
jgi:hypothetical protein